MRLEDTWLQMAADVVRSMGSPVLSRGKLEGQTARIPAQGNPRLPPTVRTGEVWHYTQLAGLRGIIGTHSLWASSYREMNDPGEIEYGLHMLKDAWASVLKSDGVEGAVDTYIEGLLSVDGLAQAFENVHLLSASREGDSLSQWRSYAGVQGFSIGLDVSTQLRVDPKDVSVRNRPDIWDFSWVKVAYSPDEQMRRGERFLRDLIEDVPNIRNPVNPHMRTAHQLLAILQMAGFKHPAYADERECRRIAMIRGIQPPSRTTSRGASAYLPFSVIEQQNAEAQKLPITAVRYGPKTSSITVHVVRQLLDEAGYGAVPLVSSEIPYR